MVLQFAGRNPQLLYDDIGGHSMNTYISKIKDLCIQNKYTAWYVNIISTPSVATTLRTDGAAKVKRIWHLLIQVSKRPQMPSSYHEQFSQRTLPSTYPAASGDTIACIG